MSRACSRKLATLLCLVSLAETKLQNARSIPDGILQGDSKRDATSKVIYGNDDRIEAFEADLLSSNHSILTHANVMLVARSRLVSSTANTYTLNDYYRYDTVCTDERFYNQPDPGFCSGFLMESRTIVTAGHCMDSAESCDSTAFIFDFRMRSASTDPEMEAIPEDRVYFCDRILEFALGTDREHDFAVVALDRAVEIDGVPREPLALGSSGTQQVGDDLILVGHPSGLPIKVAGGATVGWSNSRSVYFQANVDAYSGNSGSMVVNANTFNIEGILVRGNQDLYFDRVAGCMRSVMCDNSGCSGSSNLEGVSSVSSFESFLPNFEGLRLNKHGRHYAEVIYGDNSTTASYHFLIENTAAEDIDWSGEFLVLDESSNILSFETSSGTVPASGSEVVTLLYNPQDAIFNRQGAILDTETWILIKDHKWDHYREFTISFVRAIDMMLAGDVDSGTLTAEVGARWESMTLDTFPCGTASTTGVPAEVFAVRFAEDRAVDFVSSLPEETLLTVRGAYMHEAVCSGGGIYDYSVRGNNTYFVYVAHNDSTFFPPSFDLTVVASNDSDFVRIVDSAISLCPVVHDFTNASGIVTDGSPPQQYYESDMWVCFRLNATTRASDAQAWIQFTRIDTADFFDYIIIHDGESEFYPVLAELAGFYREPWHEIFASTSGNLFIQFRSIGFVQRTGWEFQYYLEATPGCNSSEFRCGSGECVSSALICNNNTDCVDGSDESLCELPPLCANVTTFATRTGGFSDGSSELDSYGSDLYACYLIEPTNQAVDESVWIEFSRFSVEWYSDFVFLFDGDNEFSPLLYEVTGEMLGGSGYTAGSSPGQSLFLLFHTDSLIELDGWELTYLTSNVGPTCQETDFQCDAGGCIPLDWECDGVTDCIDESDEHDFPCLPPCTNVTTSRGTLMDGPGPYENDVSMCYEIVPEAPISTDDALWIRFSHFDVEEFYDYVHIFDGPDLESAVFVNSLTGEFGHYSAEDLPTFKSTRGSFYVEFRSDGSVVLDGWRLVFWVGSVDDYCPRYTVDGSSTVTGPAANSDCVFPFTSEGTTYRDCASTLPPGMSSVESRQWCATEVDAHGVAASTESWGYCNVCHDCETRETSNAAPQNCTFPFSHEERMYYDCATVDNDGAEWCAIEINDDLSMAERANCEPCESSTGSSSRTFGSPTWFMVLWSTVAFCTS